MLYWNLVAQLVCIFHLIFSALNAIFQGLAHSMAINRSKFPLRIWVVDNSGSMQIPDGHRILATKNRNDMKFVACSR